MESDLSTATYVALAEQLRWGWPYDRLHQVLHHHGDFCRGTALLPIVRVAFRMKKADKELCEKFGQAIRDMEDRVHAILEHNIRVAKLLEEFNNRLGFLEVQVG